jgi:hypothetical protein
MYQINIPEVHNNIGFGFALVEFKVRIRSKYVEIIVFFADIEVYKQNLI